MAVHITPLGAGRHVGRSCVLVEIFDKKILFDCGISPGAKTDESHYPVLDPILGPDGQGPPKLDLVLVSHYHLDHVGALPWLTEVLGYDGPLVMTHPTRAIAPLIVQDHLKHVGRRGRIQPRFVAEDVDACFERATCLQLRQRMVVAGVAVTPYYAGHVLGGAMLLVEYRNRRVLYTGDFTTVSEHYLSAAHIPTGLAPDVMITETTCCTTVRSSKRAKEQDFCRRVEEVLESGGKVLMPVAQVGRGHEMALMCDLYWRRAGLKHPIHFIGGGMAEKGLGFFKTFASWSSDLVRQTDEPFRFRHVRSSTLEEVIDAEGPLLVFVGPASMDGGPALQLFRKWAPDRRNLVALAGYGLPGTIANLVQAKVQQIPTPDGSTIEMKCAVEYLSHSDHTDERGILQMISHATPRQVVLVHGADSMMESFLPKVERRLKLPCAAPSTGTRLSLFQQEEEDEGDEEVLVSPAVVLASRPVAAPPLPAIPRVEPKPMVIPPTCAVAGTLVPRPQKRKASELLGSGSDGALPEPKWHLVATRT